MANAETFEALAMVHREFPFLVKCVSTNGLLLKINTVLIPGVNEGHRPDLARRMASLPWRC